MKKLLILALASAVAAASNAAGDWFNVAVSGSTQTTTGASWSTTPAAADVANNVISIDADEAITLSPTATKPSPEVKTVVEVQAAFTAASDYSSLEQLGNDAKTALTVAKDGNTLKYYYWDSAESTDNKWKAITGLTPTLSETPVTVMFELDNSSTAATTAKITIGNKAVTVGLAADTSLSALAFAGTGSLRSVAATVTPAYATTETKRYASVSAALDDSVAVNAMTLHKYNGAFGEMPTPANDKVYYVKNASGTTADLGVFPASGEDGTAAKPYKIGSVEELKAFQRYVAAGFTTQGNTFTQTVDIALNEAWPGIGIQNGKDLASGDATEQEEFDADAFKGTYDGGNHTISGFQMVGVAGNPDSTTEGLDYCGFFNSTYGATIKNLKIQYAGSLFAADTTKDTKESGATFVGVAKNSTLRNLTSIAGTVSCSKGFGGIVGYLMAGSTVDSCTNNVNLTSLAPNKCGGIAMITQNGTGKATIRNCQNNGTTAGKATEKGGIVGYVGVATEIADCEDTAGSDPSFLHHQTGTLTMTGVNKAPAGVKSYTKNATNIDGLNLATVDNGVATFVKSTDLVLGNTYKVMGPGAAYMFEQAGTLTLNQSLATATVTADTSALILSSSAVDTDTTLYTAVAGVASVNNFAYATFDEAVEAIGETGDDFVTLLADATTAATAGTTLKVKTNSHSLVFADGLVVTGIVDGDITTYTTTEAVAQIGTTYYATLADAIDKAANDATVTLLKDIAVERTFVSKTLTLDLGEKTLTGRLTIDNGTVTVQNGTVAGRFDAYDSSVVTLAATATVNGPVVVWGDGTYGEAGCKTQTLNVYGSVSNTGDGAISCNGTDKSRAVINIYNGASVVSTGDVGVFLPSGVLTVSGGTITGATGIYAKSGSVTVTGGTITGNGAKTAYVYRGDGATPTGDAIVIDNAAYPNGTPAVSITGGEFTSVNADAVASYAKVADSEVKNFVSGGAFGDEVATELCAAGFIPAGPDATTGKYGVEAGWKITWVVDGVKTVDTVKKGENLTQPTDPAKSGYEFKGWTPDVLNTPVADATYTATWEQTAIPVEVTTAKTLVSVPQNCKASELIDTSNREKDDMLQVLNKATQKYYQWSYDGEGGWTPNNVATVGDNVAETPEANTIDLVRGEAVWVTRKDASKEILLKAAYTDDPVTVSVIKGYNLVAPLPKAGVDTIAIDEVVADDSTSKDRVFIPAEGKAPYNLDFKDGKWGYDKYTVEGGKLKKVRVTDVTIPAGTGFFYINNGDGTKDVTLGTGN